MIAARFALGKATTRVDPQLIAKLSVVLQRLGGKTCQLAEDYFALAECLRIHRADNVVMPSLYPDALEYLAETIRSVEMVGEEGGRHWPPYNDEELLLLSALCLLGLGGADAAECFHLLSPRLIGGCRTKGVTVRNEVNTVMGTPRKV